ncbi:MAG: homing endonuclease associated repeat-containing protein [Candidatus Paceibacteria bacterium]
MNSDNPYKPEKSKKEEILDDVKDVGESIGPKLTRSQYDDYGKYTANTVERYFSSFPNVLRRLELFPSQRISDEDIIRAINRLGGELNRPPMSSDMRKSGIYSPSAITNHFPDYHTALLVAGYNHEEIEKYKHGKVTENELIDSINTLSVEIGRPPTSTELDNKTDYSYTTYIRYLGNSIKEILKKAGFDETEIQDRKIGYENTVDKETLIDDVKRIASDTEGCLKFTHIHKEGEYNFFKYYKHLGKIDEIRELIEDE